MNWMGWNDENVETLRRCIADGLSAGQAGHKLGCTRNAAIGKALRLGWTFGGGVPSLPAINKRGAVTIAAASLKKPPREKNFSLQPRNVKPKGVKPPTMLPPPPAVSSLNAVYFGDRTGSGCCYPINSDTRNLMVCNDPGEPPRSGWSPLCAAHRKAMFSPSQGRPAGLVRLARIAA